MGSEPELSPADPRDADRIPQLEAKITYMERHIEQLDDVIHELSGECRKLARAVAKLASQLNPRTHDDDDEA